MHVCTRGHLLIILTIEVIYYQKFNQIFVYASIHAKLYQSAMYHTVSINTFKAITFSIV